MVAMFFWAPRRTEPTGRSRVTATIFPLYDIVRNVAGEAVEVRLLLKPGMEPHSFEPTPTAVRDVSGSAAIYAIGHGLDGWTAGIAASSGTPVVTVDRDIILRQGAENESLTAGAAEEDEHENEYDPHYWLSVPNAIRMAETVADDLTARFPSDAAAFRTNLDEYRSRLTALDTEIRTMLGALPADRRNIVTFHPAWYYFAEEYGLSVAGSFEVSPGREPTPRGLSALSTAVATADVRTLYVEPLFSDAAIRSFATDHDLGIAAIDDIGGTGGRDTYESLLRYDAEIIAENQ